MKILMQFVRNILVMLVIFSDVNKDLGFKAKDLGFKAKAKDLSFKAKAKDLTQVLESRPRT